MITKSSLLSISIHPLLIVASSPILFSLNITRRKNCNNQATIMRPHLSWAATTVATSIILLGADFANAFTSLHPSQASSSSITLRWPAVSSKAPTTISRLYSTISMVLPDSLNHNDDRSAASSRAVENFLSQYQNLLPEGEEWAIEFGLSPQEAAFYATFRAIHNLESSGQIKLLGLNGTPFFIPRSLLARAEGASGDESSSSRFSSFFHFSHLASALQEDFLDAQVGSTDNRKGWQVSAVSHPTGSTFDEARMTLAQVKTALESGTVIFNNIAAHIPRLAGPALASTDALSLPGAVNMYVTARGMRTSAPPHTDRQDVLVVQTEGAKRWRIFTPPTDGDVKPNADPFARGKGLDNLPLHTLLEGIEGRLGSELLMDVTLREGDVLFIPAGFPHTTDTIDEMNDTDHDASIHLTFNIDTHVWGLDYLNVRNIALRRSGIKDILESLASSALNPVVNLYVGAVNQLPFYHRAMLLDALPMGFLDVSIDDSSALIMSTVKKLEQLCATVIELRKESTAVITSESLQEALKRMHSYGSEILDIHRDMYIAAIEEGRLREAESTILAHMVSSSVSTKTTMSPERIQRLSLFRVRPFFEKINEAKLSLEHWCTVRGAPASKSSPDESHQPDSNWQLTTTLMVGDEVEADLGGAFFPAKISKIVGNTFNVVFFDGDRADGLERDQIKLSKPPKPASDEIDTTGMTKKEIKRLMKKMDKERRQE